MAKEHWAVIEAQAGIAVDPGTGLFFIGDTDTGMYLADPGEVAFALLGEEAARLTPGGMSVQHSLTVERDLVLYASDSPRIELRLSDATGDGLGSILFEAVDNLESGEIVYFDSNAMPDPEMRFYVAGESILHLWDDTIWVDGNLAAEGGLYVMGNATVDGNAIVGGELALGDWSGSTKASLLFDDMLESLFISITDSGGSEDVAQATTSRFDLFVPLSVTGDLSVHKTGGPTLKLSGMAGLQEGRILFEGPGAPEADGAIRYAPDPGLFMIRPDAATSSGQVSIDTGGVHINGDLHVTPDEYLVWHQGNLDLGIFAWTPTLGGSTTNPTTVTYTARAGYYVRLGPRLVWVFCHIATSARTGGSGDINITGFPFAITNLSNSTGGVLSAEASSLMYTTAANITARAHSAGAFRIIQSPSGAGWSYVSITNWLSTGRITFSGLVLIAPGQ